MCLSSSHGLSSSSRLGRAYSHGGVKFSSTAREGTPMYKPLLVSNIANVPLAKESHTAKPDSKSGERDFSLRQGYLQHYIVRAQIQRG